MLRIFRFFVSAARGSKPVAAPPVLWGSARRTASALPKRLPSAALRDVEWHDLLAGLSVEYNLFQSASKNQNRPFKCGF